MSGASISGIPQSDRDVFPENLRGFTLVEFYSPHCFHCRLYSSTIKKVDKYLKINFPQVQLEQFSCKGGKWCQYLNLEAIPALRLYNGPKLISELDGRRRFKTVTDWLEKHSRLFDQSEGNIPPPSVPIPTAIQPPRPGSTILSSTIISIGDFGPLTLAAELVSKSTNPSDYAIKNVHTVKSTNASTLMVKNMSSTSTRNPSPASLGNRILGSILHILPG